MAWGRYMGHMKETPPCFIILSTLPVSGVSTWATAQHTSGSGESLTLQDPIRYSLKEVRS